MTAVEVTDRDISDGLCNDGFACAMATAINRKLKSDLIVHVTPTQFAIYPRRGRAPICYESGLPFDARSFVRRFDTDRARARPGVFELEIPTEYLCESIPAEVVAT